MKKNAIHYAQALGNEVADKRIDILRRIGQVGSISEAARGAGVSYKAAWQAIETLTNLSGALLVEKVVGGAGGGGAQLTKTGQRLLEASDLLNAAKNDVIAKLNTTAEASGALPGLASLSPRTSMRNQLPCKIKTLAKSGPSLRVELELADGGSIFSRITRESAQLLGLHRGQHVLALFKATAVQVARQASPQEGFNMLAGIVTRAPSSSSGGEAGLSLPCGLKIVGMASTRHGLRVRGHGLACLEDSAVVIALAG